jgi:two-component system, OmpR family, response regulator
MTGTQPEQSAALRVLLVEDHADTALSLAKLLRIWGHEVEVAASGQTAVQAAEAFAPDVALLDIGLPDTTGWDVAKQLRAQATSKRPLFIAVTGWGSVEDRLRSDEAGIDLHLVKPADPDALRGLLARFKSVLGK